MSDRPRPRCSSTASTPSASATSCARFSLARALAERFRVVAAVRRRAAAGPPPRRRGSRSSQLPPARSWTATASLGSHDAAARVERRPCALRRRMILDAFRRSTPAVVVIELFPFGRAKFAAELAAAARGGARAQASRRSCRAACATSSSRRRRRPGRLRRARLRAGQPLVRRGARARRPALRPPRGLLRSRGRPARARALHGVRAAGRGPAAAAARAAASSSRPAAGGWASRS